MKPRVSAMYSRLRIGLPPNIASSCTQALRLSLMKGVSSTPSSWQ